jgi:hypothetical protein
VVVEWFVKKITMIQMMMEFVIRELGMVIMIIVQM